MSQSREKPTRIKQTRPPVSTYLPDHPTLQPYIDLDGRPQTLEFGELIKQDSFPIPMPVDREGYLPDHDHRYWASGHTDWLNVQSAINELGVGPQTGNQKIRLLDIGCATGRVLRHVNVFGSGFEAYGSDLAPANIAWMKRYLPAAIKATSNTTEARLDFPDNFFDVVTGFSFMPHLDEAELDWLQELNRVTHPNGILYLTIANDATWSIGAERESTFHHFNSVPGNQPFSKSTFTQPLPEDRIVRKMSTRSVYNCFVWHRDAFIESVWGKSVNVCRIADRAHLDYQSVLLARPKK